MFGSVSRGGITSNSFSSSFSGRLEIISIFGTDEDIFCSDNSPKETEIVVTFPDFEISDFDLFLFCCSNLSFFLSVTVLIAVDLTCGVFLICF